MLPAQRIALIVLFTILPPAAIAAVGSAPAMSRPPSDAVHYRQCLSLSSANPAAALADADGWARKGGGVPADHCAALALVNLKRYAEAGARLDRAAGAKGVPNGEFRVALFDQAGNAWLLAGNGARAVQSFSAALTLSAGDADLFADLARAQAMVKNWHEVDLDLNAALQLSPRRGDLLILRASARRALNHYDEARRDIEAALKLKPNDGNALLERGLLRKQLGDLGGARRDFQAALKASPSGATAADAKQNLQSLSP
jgi:tetratricopeptide (TPR) repeat protein